MAADYATEREVSPRPGAVHPESALRRNRRQAIGRVNKLWPSPAAKGLPHSSVRESQSVPESCRVVITKPEVAFADAVLQPRAAPHLGLKRNSPPACLPSFRRLFLGREGGDQERGCSPLGGHEWEGFVSIGPRHPAQSWLAQSGHALRVEPRREGAIALQL